MIYSSVTRLSAISIKPFYRYTWPYEIVTYSFIEILISPQIVMSLVANSSVLGPSMAFGYSAVALGPLMAPNSDVKINSVQGNWIGQYPRKSSA